MENSTAGNESKNKTDSVKKKNKNIHELHNSTYIHKEKPSFVQKEKTRLHDFLLDHEKTNDVLNWTWLILLTVVSSFCFSYGYRAFISPGGEYPALISGGVSGISQVILRFLQIFGYPTDIDNENLVTSIGYFALNIPIFFIAFRFIGKKFFILTALNVLFTSLLIRYLPNEWVTIFSDMNDDYIARAIFAGLMTGVSSGLAFWSGSSTGGVDVISFYIAERKSTTIGKYSIIINVCTVLTYTIVNAIRLNSFGEVAMSLYTCIYFFTAGKVLDIINIKNKKIELQINTDNIELAPILLRAFPHGCTVIDAIGGYTGKPRKVIYMVVSASEVKEVVNVARKIDPNCFVNVTNSMQVYGKFYVKPIQ